MVGDKGPRQVLDWKDLLHQSGSYWIGTDLSFRMTLPALRNCDFPEKRSQEPLGGRPLRLM